MQTAGTVPSGGMRSLNESLAHIERRLAERQARAHVASHTVAAARPVPAVGPVSRRIVQSIQFQLFGLEHDERFESTRIQPQREYPLILTRCPVFLPGRRDSQKELLDKDNALPFETPWGRGRRHGPPLTTDDEDTLMALMRLRQVMLRGTGSQLPVAQSELGEPQVVHALYCMVGDIQRELGAQRGGRNNELRLESVKRLAATQIEFDTRTADKLCGKGTVFKLIDVVWSSFADEALIYVQFTPLVARLLDSSYAYIAWEVRRELTDVGKAIHRFLSGQPRSYCIGAEKLRATIGYTREFGSFMRDLRVTMDRLKALGWLSAYEIEGTGRNHPYKLRIER